MENPFNCKHCNRHICDQTRSLTCVLCCCSFHFGCVDPQNCDNTNWFCLYCANNIFPFNAITDNNVYINNINSFFDQENMLLTHLNRLTFNPFEINDDSEILPLVDIDPDLNYFNSLASITSATKCNYYIDESINKDVSNAIKENLSLFHLNIRSLPKHHSDLTNYLQGLELEFSVIGLSETWLSNANEDLYNIENYNNVNVCRESRRGGGVSLFIRNSLSYKILHDLMFIDDFIECLFVEIEITKNKYTIVGIIYRPPNTNLEEFNRKFGEITAKLKHVNKTVYLMGDFNINLLNHDRHAATSDFLETLYSASFFPLITKPTRITNETATLIDNIFCNYSDIDNFVNGILFTDLSDHFPVFTINKACNEEVIQKYINKRSYSQQNHNRFIQEIDEFNWDQIYNLESCQDAFTFFHTNLKSIYEKSFPLKTFKVGYLNRKPWLTTGLKNSIKVKNKLYMKSKKYKSEYLDNKYKLYKKQLSKLLKIAEKQHYHHLLESNKRNLKKSWAIIKDVIGKKKIENSNCNKEFLIDGRIVSDKNVIANNFNNFFSNIGKNLAKDIPENNINPLQYMGNIRCEHSFFLRPTDESEIRKVVALLKNTGAGWDSINTKAVKDSLNRYVKHMVYIINLSFIQGYFPHELKLARVIPLYKSGDSQLVKNYRPVSILPVISKIFERIMFNRLLDFINKHNLLYKFQFGFRPGHNTSHALMILIDKILSGFNDNEMTIGVFLDFSKAFDTVNHHILLNKLSRYGIRGPAHQWLTSYLSERKQYVSYNGVSSSTSNVSCGVPQGSILGPLLFILYINDMHKVSNKLSLISFADDSNLFIQGKNINEMINILNTELQEINFWIQANKLSLNVGKTNFILFKPKRKATDLVVNDIKINNIVIDRIYKTKFLGVIISHDLSWDHHTKHVSNKVAKGIGVILRARHNLDQKTLLILYYSFVYPYLGYCVEVWGATTKRNVLCLHRLQKKILRIITFSDFYAHTDHIFKSLFILNFEQIYLYSVLLFMFKHYHKKCPLSMNFLFNENIHNNYNTRQISHYCLPLYRLKICQSNITYKGAKIWNTIVNKIEVNCCYYTFKKQIKKILICTDLSEFQ